MKKMLFLFLISIFSSIPMKAQLGMDMPTDREPGSCYAKSLISDKVEIVDKKLPISRKGAEGGEALSVLVAEATTKWVKKKSDKPCHSNNPEDCSVWCLVEVPAKYETFYVVKDTIANPDFEWQTFQVQEVVEKGGGTAWQKVICNSQVTPKFLRKLAASLTDKGYPVTFVGNGNVMGSDFKAALIKYQKENYLPIGSLDFTTMRSLGLMKEHSRVRRAKHRRRKNRRSH